MRGLVETAGAPRIPPNHGACILLRRSRSLTAALLFRTARLLWPLGLPHARLHDVLFRLIEAPHA